MTQGNFHHRRTPSGSNTTKVRTSRPALHRRGTSFVTHSISKLGSGQPTKHLEVEDDRQPEMAASFLNFCAMCERQITVPDNTLLYCSESCRRKDSHKPLSASFPSTSSMSSSSTPPTSPLMSPRMIVAPLTPTKSSTRLSSSARIPGEWLDAKPDQDPTEWKPVIPMGTGTTSLATSDAWKYLSQFHNEDSGAPLRRPGFGHRSSASLSTLMSATGPAPSLTHTPSTVASSFSSNASDYVGQMHDPVYRPLPPRHNPHTCSSSATKGVELVVPHVHVQAEGVSLVDMSDEGSIFPASSALWNEKPLSKTSTLTTTLDAVSSNVPMRSV